MELNHSQMRRFNSAFKSHYATWLVHAPESYTKDGFFENRIPISITSKFGQNQPTAMASTEDADAGNWDRERDYGTIRYVSVAIATHIR